MILSKSKMESDSFLDVNNDIYRMMTVLNDCVELKRMLIYTDKRPLEDYDVINRKSLKELGVNDLSELDLRDSHICRVPVLPLNEEDGSMIVITTLSGEEAFRAKDMRVTIAIDVFTPANQWIINEGIRPLQIAHIVNNVIKKDFNPTGGIKYRLAGYINCQLNDVMLGYRLLFDSVVDD